MYSLQQNKVSSLPSFIHTTFHWFYSSSLLFKLINLKKTQNRFVTLFIIWYQFPHEPCFFKLNKNVICKSYSFFCLDFKYLEDFTLLIIITVFTKIIIIHER